jgi:hypothetical protein
MFLLDFFNELFTTPLTLALSYIYKCKSRPDKKSNGPYGQHTILFYNKMSFQSVFHLFYVTQSSSMTVEAA